VLQDIDPLEILNIGDPNEDLENALPASDFQALQIGARDWTVQTLISQVLVGNIELDPRFQRRNAWNDVKRSRFVESLILGVPIPQLVLAEIREQPGKFVVIDGKQRLLTLASLQSPKYDTWNKARFANLLTLTELEGVELSDFISSSKFTALRRQLANQSIRAALVVGTKTDDVLYDIFYRVNSGSVPLSGQELRQVLLRGGFSDFLFEATNTHQPIHSVMNIVGPDQRMYDAEMVLRALSTSMALVPYQGNLKSYLDKTTKILNDTWADQGGQAISAYAELNTSIERLKEIVDYREIGRRLVRDRFERPLNKALLEVQLYYFRKLPTGIAASKAEFKERFTELCHDSKFLQSIESTTKSIERFRHRFESFRKLVLDVYAVDGGMPLIHGSD
jgi:Protein of unknown function DUF262